MKQVLLAVIVLALMLSADAYETWRSGTGFSLCYQIQEDGTVSIGTGNRSDKSLCFNDSASKSVTLPSVIDGRVVTRIADYAFDDCDELTHMTIPTPVGSIGESAFTGCSELYSIEISDSVTNIGVNAFVGCNRLKTVKLSKHLTEIHVQTFERCSALTAIDIPFGVTNIGASAFCECGRLVAVTIPSSVKTIGRHAFQEQNSFYRWVGIQSLTQINVDVGDGERVKRMLQDSGFDTAGVKYIEKYAIVRFDFPEGTRHIGGGEICQRIELGKSAVDPLLAVDDGLWFVGWDKDVSCISDNMVVSGGVARIESVKRNGQVIVSIEKPFGWTVYYTTDGSDPSVNSTEWNGPLVLSDKDGALVKLLAKSVNGGTGAIYTYEIKFPQIETPVVSPVSAAFDGASLEVTISCATEGATVYYTIDGSEPNVANGRVYKGPFNIYDSVTVKAIAVKDDWKDSAVASAAFTKNNGLSAAINMYDYLPDYDANAPWTVDAEVSHDGVSSARSGAIGENGVTTMKVTVRGAGRLSFWWKSECEACDEDYYDYGVFFVGSETEPRLRIAGMTDWKREEVVFDTTGKHVCKWEYHKDDAETIPRDCIWVDQVQWLPYGESEHDHTLTTEVSVPYLWLDSYGLGRETDFETAAKMKLGKVDGAGRAISVEDDYVAGTDPTNLASKLTATIKMGADGRPILSWKPPLNGEDEDGAGIREGVRLYSVYGKQTLDDAEEEWTPVADGDEGNYRFFKVGVGMP